MIGLAIGALGIAAIGYFFLSGQSGGQQGGGSFDLKSMVDKIFNKGPVEEVPLMPPGVIAKTAPVNGVQQPAIIPTLPANMQILPGEPIYGRSVANEEYRAMATRAYGGRKHKHKHWKHYYHYPYMAGYRYGYGYYPYYDYYDYDDDYAFIYRPVFWNGHAYGHNIWSRPLIRAFAATDKNPSDPGMGWSGSKSGKVPRLPHLDKNPLEPGMGWHGAKPDNIDKNPNAPGMGWAGEHVKKVHAHVDKNLNAPGMGWHGAKPHPVIPIALPPMQTPSVVDRNLNSPGMGYAYGRMPSHHVGYPNHPQHPNHPMMPHQGRWPHNGRWPHRAFSTHNIDTSNYQLTGRNPAEDTNHMYSIIGDIY